MKKVAVTVAVLALGLAACAQNNEANNMAENDLYTENAAETDMNMSLNETENAADTALENATESLENAGEAVENAGEAVDEAGDNAQ